MKFGWIIFKLTLVTDSWVTSWEIPLSWISLNLTDDKSTLVQVMAWCRQATSYCLNQCWPRSMSPYGITRPQWVNVMRKERLRQRKWDKKAGARYCSMSSMDSVSMLLDSTEEEGLDSSECESSSSILKSVVKVTRPSPAPWDTDVDSPPRKCSKKDSTWGEWGRNWEMDRQGCYSRDWSDSGFRDEGHHDQDDGSRSTVDTGHAGSHSPSRSRATTEQKHSSGAECCEDSGLPQMLVQLGPVSPRAGLPQTGLTVLMVLPPHRRKSLRAWCPVLLGLFLAGFRLPWTRFWVLGPLRTKLKMIRLSAQMGPLPCGRGQYLEPKSCPAGPSPLGELATMGKLWSARLSENWISTVAAFSLWVGMDQPGDPVGPVLDPHQASRGLDTVSAVSSETQKEVCSAKDDNTNELTQIGTDNATQDRDVPPVEAAGAVTMQCRASWELSSSRESWI